MRWLVSIAVMVVLPMIALADDKTVRLSAPASLVDTGLLKHILPRFSLKTQVRVEMLSDPEGAHLIFGDSGSALFQGNGVVWHIDVRSENHSGTARFVDWLTSDIGQRTIFSFAPDGTAMFEPPSRDAVEVATTQLDGDAALGQKVSRSHCARCHAIDEAGRKNDIGSSPSFFVLRSLSDWQERFEAFYVLNPHPAFTQITDVTEPFADDRPPPIVPIELSLDDLEAVLAFVSALKAADLGSPLIHQ